jgi:hypothetical protein
MKDLNPSITEQEYAVLEDDVARVLHFMEREVASDRLEYVATRFQHSPEYSGLPNDVCLYIGGLLMRRSQLPPNVSLLGRVLMVILWR